MRVAFQINENDMPSKENNEVVETHHLFPSGEWEGFYTYAHGPGAERHIMSFILQFQNNVVTGNGGDDVGPFSWRGQYDKENLRCQMTKYYNTHTVFYDGQVDENGIWGTWTIGDYFRGGFHIWPKIDLENAAIEGKEAAPETYSSLEKIVVGATGG